ncbi:Protocatechuate 3,4-dioxygenase beta chain [Rubripirellula lacrimiformis]|uniref:Protocatechuate 3,4-dioxygenase beta chain n=1 Tax=Rubripirellula lacrimiformis TaxID=1930273 RepID=A0A517NE65_9BACT|nr:protocatechuate 3,4-dioxygenase [Rubripirellula lacrimiformis]QDT05425.1 Protocatechuate 3,4-dioxygenase beta chain [Rubripirellula lacrimiformis]
MFPKNHLLGRREILQGGVAVGTAAFTTAGVFADMIQTPPQTEGPFYPNRMPLDTDNDLLVINDSITPGVGEITHLSGRVLDRKGNPIRNAFVEIWQVDNNAVYIHTDDRTNRDNQDTNFQGYGRFLTDSKGQYYFRTIKPVPYPGRTPHIHFGISKNAKRILTTQLYVKDHPANAKDGILNRIDKTARETVLGDFNPIPGSKFGELAVNFDIVLGITAQEAEDGTMHGMGKSDRQGGRRRG